MRIELEAGSLVLLVGPSGAGKTTLAARHFPKSAVLSSDAFREMVADDPSAIAASSDAFDILHLVAERRLASGRLTVIDATNLEAAARGPLLRMAKRAAAPTVAIAIDLPLELCLAQNRARPGRRIPLAVVRRQHARVPGALAALARESIDKLVVLRSAEEISRLMVVGSGDPFRRRRGPRGQASAVR